MIYLKGPMGSELWGQIPKTNDSHAYCTRDTKVWFDSQAGASVSPVGIEIIILKGYTFLCPYYVPQTPCKCHTMSMRLQADPGL